MAFTTSTEFIIKITNDTWANQVIDTDQVTQAAFAGHVQMYMFLSLIVDNQDQIYKVFFIGVLDFIKIRAQYFIRITKLGFIKSLSISNQVDD